MYWLYGLRRDASLLVSEGHADAHSYPIARLWWEARIVRERLMERMALQASLQHSSMTAIAESIFAKKGAQRPANKAFQELLKRMSDGEAG